MIETAYIMIVYIIFYTISLRIYNEYNLRTQMKDILNRLIDERKSGKGWKEIIFDWDTTDVA